MNRCSIHVMQEGLPGADCPRGLSILGWNLTHGPSQLQSAPVLVSCILQAIEEAVKALKWRKGEASTSLVLMWFC